jgi:hypothetical protein
VINGRTEKGNLGKGEKEMEGAKTGKGNKRERGV